MNPLEVRIKELENRLNNLERSDHFEFKKQVQFFDGRNFQFGTATGSVLGTTALQKIGFFGGTPRIQTTLRNPSVVSVEACVDDMYTGFINNGFFRIP